MMGGEEMMKINAKSVTRGIAEGEALISHMPISFMVGMDPDTGIIREPGHELEGQSVAEKILVFPMAKGSATACQHATPFSPGHLYFSKNISAYFPKTLLSEIFASRDKSL